MKREVQVEWANLILNQEGGSLRVGVRGVAVVVVVGLGLREFPTELGASHRLRITLFLLGTVCFDRRKLWCFGPRGTLFRGDDAGSRGGWGPRLRT